MPPMPRLTLSYFGFGGRAEPMRLACVVGRFPFVNKSINFEDWETLKPQYPLGRLPMLEIQEPGKKPVQLSQSIAILRYLGCLGQLYPEDPLMAAKVDAIMDAVADAQVGLEISVKGVESTLLRTEEWTEDEKHAFRHRLSENEQYGLPYYFAFFEKSLNDNNTGWFVGDSVTIADLFFHRLTAWILSGFIIGVPTSLLDAYPAVKRHHQAIEDMPEVVAFREKYPTPYTDFNYFPSF